MFLISRGEIIGRFDAIYYSESNNLKIANETIYPVKKLSDIAILQRGKFSHRPRNDERFYNGEYPFIQTGDIVRASQSNEAIRFTQTLNELGLSVSKLFSPDVLIITIAANIGDTAILTYPACFPDSLVTITPKNAAVSVYYLNVYFKYVKDYLLNLAPQAAQKNINLQQLSPTPIVVPPRKIQAEIVSIFETAHASKKQKQDEAAALLASIDGYLLRELGITLPLPSEKQPFFYTRINKIRGGRFDPFFYQREFDENNNVVYNGIYKTFRLKESIQTLVKGRLPKDEEKVGPLKVVQINSINPDGNIDTGDLLTAKAIFSSNQQMQKNDVLVVITGATIGKIAIWEQDSENYFLGGDIVKFQCRKNINPNFVFAWLRCQNSQIEIKRNVTGATNGHLSPSDIGNIFLPLPPLEKQTEIAEHISALRLQAKRLRSEAEAEFQSAQQTIEKMILGES
jgi:restriction endonuclease S subunit